MNLTVTLKSTKTSARVQVVGDLDYATTNEFVDTVSRVLTEHTALEHLRLTFSGLTFCDSAGLSGLLMIHRRCEEADVQLHLDDRPAQLERILQITGTLEHLTAARNSGDADELADEIG